MHYFVSLLENSSHWVFPLKKYKIQLEEENIWRFWKQNCSIQQGFTFFKTSLKNQQQKRQHENFYTNAFNFKHCSGTPYMQLSLQLIK